MNTMLKASSLFLVVSVLFLAQPSTRAQTPQNQAPNTAENDRTDKTRVGIGVSLNPLALVRDDGAIQPTGVTTWYIPIQVGKFFRCETEIAYTVSRNQYLQMLGTTPVQQDVTESYLRIGEGVFYTSAPNEAGFRWYAGLRSGVLFGNISFTTTLQTRPQVDVYDQTKAAFWLGASVGAEHYFSPHCSIGAELQCTWYDIGAPNSVRSVPPPNIGIRYPLDTQRSTLATNGLLFLRFFF
jgi:hypothetical protein